MNTDPLRVLIIDDSEDDALLLVEELQRGGYVVVYEQVYTPETLSRALEQHWDIILSDHSMPQFSGTRALRMVKAKAVDAPFIIVSGTMSEDAAVESLKAGAVDYFSKDKITRLLPAVRRELHDANTRREHQRAEEQLQRAEFALRRSEASLAEAQRIAQLGNWEWDVETDEIFWSSGLYNLFELPQDRTPLELQEFVATLVHPQDRAMVEQMLEVATQELKSFNIEYRIVLPERGERFIQSRAEVKSSETGGSARMVGILQDITERKRIETAEREQRMFAEALRETAAALNSTLELDHVLDAILEYVERVVPHDAAKIALIEGEHARVVRNRGYEGRGVTALLPLEDLQHLRWIIKTRQPFSISDTELYTGWKRLSDMAWVRSNLTAPITVMGSVIGFLVLDSTTRGVFTAEHARRLQVFADQASIAFQNAQLYEALVRQSEALEQRVAERTRELQHAKDRVDAILNSASDALLLTDTDGKIEQTTPAFGEEFGYQGDELLGQSLFVLLEPEHFQKVTDALQDMLALQIGQRIELIARRKNGETFDAEVSLTSTSEETRTILCSVRDITVRKQTEGELRESLEQQRELAELRSRFGSMLSHEFRNPLAVIQFSSSILKEYDYKITSEKRIEHLTKIQAQVRRLVSLLDDYLMVSRSEKTRASFNPSSVDVIAFCREIVEETRLIAETHDIRLEISGQCQSALLDPHLMRQAITNLITNAIKYSPQGKIVDMSLNCDEAQITITVRDYGIGIPEADQKRLFETFYRATNVGAIPGTGLGLTIIKQAAELHGGTVAFESKVGEGTAFSISIPIHDDR